MAGLARRYQRRNVYVTLSIVFSVFSLWVPNFASAAACPPPATDIGSVSTSVNVPGDGTYRVWSRIMAADTTNNSYSLEIDGANCYVVGDSAIAANTWTWVDYQNASSASKINSNLITGSHNVKLIGREPNVKVDRVLFLGDTTCVPVDTGDNCLATPPPPPPPADTTSPTVSLTTPTDGSTVSGTVNMTATATDNVGVTKVEFYVDGALKATDTSAPYSFAVDTTTLSNISHTMSAKAFDAAGNSSTDSISVTVQNGDTQAPSTPTNVVATATAYNRVNVSWAASTDNVGVTGYDIYRNDSLIAKVGVQSPNVYTDTSVSPATNYSYRVRAFDAAGNTSGLSTIASVVTPQVPDTTAPTVPTNLTPTVVGSSQVNLSWMASSDNIGVTGYDVYRNGAKVATVTTTSFGDTGLTASTTYSYYVRAKDAAGNLSAQSASVSATTTAPVSMGNIAGTVTNRLGGGLNRVKVILYVNGSKMITLTDSLGKYNMPNIPAGSYEVIYKKNGYRTQKPIVTVTAGQTTTKDITLIKL